MGLLGRFFKPDVNGMKNRADVKGLVKALDHDGAYYGAVEALGQLCMPGFSLYERSSGGVPQASFTGNAQAADALMKASKHPNPHVRSLVVRALGELGRHGKSDVAEVLMECRDDPSLRLGVGIALAKLRHPGAMEPLVDALRRGSEEAAKALGDLGDKQAVGPLTEALSSRTAGMRWSAVDALGRIADHAAVEPLIRCLEDEDVNVRHGAAAALEKIPDSRAVEPLIEALRLDQSEKTLRALAKTRDRRAIEPLIFSLRHGDSYVSGAARLFLDLYFKDDERVVAALQGKEDAEREEKERAARERRERIDKAHQQYGGASLDELVDRIASMPGDDEIQLIGHELHLRGGAALMRSAHQAVLPRLCDRARQESAVVLRTQSLEFDPAARLRAEEVARAQAAERARDVERLWDGIGDWLG
jgi:HEAT repeat protein